MNRQETSLSAQITSTPEGMKVWQQERVIFEVTERICDLMREQGISRSDLAGKLVRSRGYVTQLLSGKNLTLRTLSDVYLALGRQFHPNDGPVTIENDNGPIVYSYVSAEDDWEFEAGDVEPEWKVGVV